VADQSCPEAMCRRPQIEIRTVSAEISVAILSFVLLMTAWTLIGPNGGTLASAEVPENPGRGLVGLGSRSGSPRGSSPRSPDSAVSQARVAERQPQIDAYEALCPSSGNAHRTWRRPAAAPTCRDRHPGRATHRRAAQRRPRVHDPPTCSAFPASTAKPGTAASSPTANNRTDSVDPTAAAEEDRAGRGSAGTGNSCSPDRWSGGPARDEHTQVAALVEDRVDESAAAGPGGCGSAASRASAWPSCRPRGRQSRARSPRR